MKLLGSYPLDGADVLEMGSDLLKVTQLDVTELEPKFLIPSPLCFLGPNRGHLLEPEQSGLALCCSRPHHRWGSQQEGSGPGPGLSVLLNPYGLSCHALLPLCHHQPTTWPWELPFWGTRSSERRKGVGSFDRCCFQFLFNSSPFYFTN